MHAHAMPRQLVACVPHRVAPCVLGACLCPCQARSLMATVRHSPAERDPRFACHAAGVFCGGALASVSQQLPRGEQRVWCTCQAHVCQLQPWHCRKLFNLHHSVHVVSSCGSRMGGRGWHLHIVRDPACHSPKPSFRQLHGGVLLSLILKLGCVLYVRPAM